MYILWQDACKGPPISLLCYILVYFLWITSSTAQFFDDGLTVRDVKNGVNWLRCTVGQTWNYDTEKCDGEIVKLNHTEIEEARKQASEQLGGIWRLPTLDELESLVCEKCEKPKINEKAPNKSRPRRGRQAQVPAEVDESRCELNTHGAFCA